MKLISKSLSVVKSLSHVRLFATPWMVAHQAPYVCGISQARILERVAIFFSIKIVLFRPLFLFVLYFGVAVTRHMGSQLPNQESNPYPLYLKPRVLITGPSGKLLFLIFHHSFDLGQLSMLDAVNFIKLKNHVHHLKYPRLKKKKKYDLLSITHLSGKVSSKTHAAYLLTLVVYL